jgi:hypothetical protein
MAQNPREIELDSLVFTEEEEEDLEVVTPVEEFTLVPEGRVSSADKGNFTQEELETEAENTEAGMRRALENPEDYDPTLVNIARQTLTGSSNKPPTWNITPDLLELYRQGIDLQTGETVDLNSDEQINYLLNDTAEVLSENPFYYDRGGINVTDLKVGKGPIFEILFPEFFDQEGNATEAQSDYFQSDDYEKEKTILSRLTNLEGAGLEDYLKAGTKGGVEGYASARAALTTGRFTLAATTPFLGFGSIPLSIVTGLGAAMLTSYGLNPVGERFLPRRENLLPGESAHLEGIRSAASIMAGAPVVKDYAAKAYGPSILIQRMKEAGPIKLSRGQRFSAYLDEMFPKAKELYQKNPKKFLASEAVMAGGVGTVVSKAELDDDPLLRTAVELGLGLSPTYTFVDIAQNVVKNKFGASTFLKYSPTGLVYKPVKLYSNYKDLAKRISSSVSNRFKDNKDLDVAFLKTEEGQRAAYKVLQFFIQNGEKPKEVLEQLQSGVSWLDGLPQEALDIVNSSGAGEVTLRDAVENISPGMRSGSPTLIMLENFFRTQNDEIKNARDPLGKKAAQFQTALIKLFTAGGSKGDLEIARELQQNIFTDKMISKLSDAVDQATNAAIVRSKGSDQYQTLAEISQAQSRALEQQFSYANGMSAALYEEARKVGGVGKLLEFKDAEGTVLEAPSFIKKWDQRMSEASEDQIKRWSKDTFFESVQEQVNKFKTQLNLKGAPAATTAQLKLTENLKKQEYSNAKTVFERVLNNDFNYSLSGSGDKYNNPPLIAVNDEGIPLATERNIENLTILMDSFMSAVKTPKVKALLQMQKEALQAEIALEKGIEIPREGIDFSDLVNLGKDLTTWKASNTSKGNDFFGMASVMKQAVFEDINNTIPADVSEPLNTARSFYKAFKNAISRTVAGAPSRRKGYNEREIDEEDFARSLLQGNDESIYSKLKPLFYAGQFLRDEAKRLFPEDTFIEVFDPATQKTTRVPLKDSIKYSMNTIESLTQDALSVDIISPLQRKLNEVEARTIGMPEQQALELKAKALSDALVQIQTRLSSDAGGAFKELLGEGFVNDILKMEDGLAVLQKARVAYNIQKQDIVNDFSLGVAINTQSPYAVIKNAINNSQGKGVDILDSFIRDIKKTTGSENKPEGWSEQKALAGMKKNILDLVYEKAGGEDGFSADAAYSVLYRNGEGFKNQPDKNLADYMLRRKIITEQELNNYGKLLKSIKEFEIGVELGNIDMTLQKASLAKVIAAKLLAVRLVKFVPGSRSGGIVEEGIAARAATNFVDRLPGLKQEGIMRKIIQDEKLLALVLKEPVDNPEQRGIFVKVFKQLGITPETTRAALRAARERVETKPGRAGSVVPRVISPDDFEDEEEVLQEEPQASLERSPVAPTDGAGTPEPRPFIVAQMPTAQQPSAPQARPSGSSGVASSSSALRARYKNDYPNDIVSSLIPEAQGQGIESLLS